MEELNNALRISGSKIYNSYSWFKWIAGLSLINTLLMIFGSNISFIFGLASNIFLYAFGVELFGEYSIITLSAQLIFPVIYFLLYRMNKSMKKWPIIVGVVLYGLDALLYLLIDDMLSILFHAYVMYSVLKSFWEIDQFKETLSKLEALNQQSQVDETIIEVN